MDETKGAHAEPARRGGPRRDHLAATPDLFQSLNATGAVRITTRSGGDEWHGNLFGNFRDRASDLPAFPRAARNTAASNTDSARAARSSKTRLSCSSAANAPSRMEFCRFRSDSRLPTVTSLRSAYFRENMLIARLRLQLQRQHEGLRARQLRQRKRDRASEQFVEFPQPAQRSLRRPSDWTGTTAGS